MSFHPLRESMPKPSCVFRSQIRTWREYKRALINRDHLSVWFDEPAILGACDPGNALPVGVVEKP